MFKSMCNVHLNDSFDESSFHANESQSWQWDEEDKLALHPKSQGQVLMVSDFIDEQWIFVLESRRARIGKIKST